MTPQSVLAVDRIHFSRPLGDGFRPILSDISFHVAPGQIAAILGANGSGKSTLLRLAVGYLWPQRGSIQLLGHTLGEVPVADLRKRIGLVEAVSVYPFDETMSARDVVVSGYFTALTIGYLHPEPDQWAHADHLLEQVGLTAQRDQLYHTLSTGQRMRALVARALVRRPELLILDEPTSGLDLPSRESVLATVTRLWESATPKPAIITVTHHLEELLPATSAILLLSQSGTTVASGPPAEVLTAAHLTEAYGVPIDVQQRNGRWWASVNPTVWPTLLE